MIRTLYNRFGAHFWNRHAMRCDTSFITHALNARLKRIQLVPILRTSPSSENYRIKYADRSKQNHNNKNNKYHNKFASQHVRTLITALFGGPDNIASVYSVLSMRSNAQEIWKHALFREFKQNQSHKDAHVACGECAGEFVCNVV